MKILCICDDFYHPLELIKEGLSSLLEEGNEIVFAGDTTIIPPAILKDYNKLILSKANMTAEDPEMPWLNDQWEDAIFHFVERGGSLIVIHSGTAGYGGSSKLKTLMGGIFSDHPDPCPVTYTPVSGYPETEGVEAFKTLDEHYFMKMEGEDVDVFLTSRSIHGQQPAGWICRSDAGEVAVLTPGHRKEVWKNSQFRKLLINILERENLK